MKARKMRELTPEEVEQQLVDARTELFNLRIRKGSHQLDQPSRIRLLRRNVARILTIRNERARAAR